MSAHHTIFNLMLYFRYVNFNINIVSFVIVC